MFCLVRAAAELLGFTKIIWDKDQDPPVIKAMTWSDLRPEQQEAAKLFNYDEDDFKSPDGSDRENYDDCDWEELPLHGKLYFFRGQGSV